MPNYRPHHIHLMSHDAMAAASFYEKMFGATVESSKGANGLPRANMRLGDQLILISTVAPSVTQAGHGPHSCLGLDHLGISVDDMDAACADLRKKDAHFSMQPRGNGSVKIAFVDAPDGVSIELVCNKVLDLG